ncbi:UNVERIFIED_CONTAM: hypothetical protein PYX00_005366 [Menopon gallinae]|uniref:TOG domain-containing protein n=1 Tax=Menopon gallinae TaxID=328185 RepID=A0AAW2HRW2_9NEOP
MMCSYVTCTIRAPKNTTKITANMADVELSKALKDLPIRIQTSSRKERKVVIENVISVLSHPNITESIVRGICRVLLLTLTRYRDSTSQAYVRNLVKALVKCHRDAALKHLVLTLYDHASVHKNIVASKNTANTALCSLSWTCILVQSCNDKNFLETYVEYQKLVETQAMLILSICAAENKKQIEHAQHLMNLMWNRVQFSWEMYGDTMTKLEPSPHYVLLGSFYLKFLKQNKQDSLIKKYKTSIIDALVKVGISCKKKPESYIVKESTGVLQLVTHEEFSSTILPALQKAILRSPEIILENVSFVLSGLSLDLSQYVMDIGKQIVANLHSNDDLSRDLAAEACRQLARQCTDSTSLQNLLNHLFEVYNGSEGKLTVTAQKISMLQGAGYISENGVTGSSAQQLAAHATEHFMKVLETEVHEKTLIFALEMLSKWGSKFTQVPKKLIDWFEKGMGLKTSTPAVRTAYIDCMSECFHNETLNQCTALAGVLANALEKGCAPGASQTKALSAAYLLLRLATAGACPEKYSNMLWNILLDVDKQFFVSDKFLGSANEGALLNVIRLCEKLLMDHADRVNGKDQALHKAVLYCLTKTSKNVRSVSRNIVKRLVSILGGTQLALALIKQFSQLLDSVSASQVTDNNKENTGERETGLHALADAFVCICGGSNLCEEDTHQIALATLVCAHHPLLRQCARNFWLKLLKQLNVDPKNFINLHKSELHNIFTKEYVPNESVGGALTTVISLEPDIMLPTIISYAMDRLNKSAAATVTREEYLTYMTPEGELFDKSVISGTDQETSSTSNLKRESKVYSYKEQIEEMQLRRELEEKKRKAGKLKEPELTPKQKELMRVQLEKENAIRSRLKSLNDDINNSVSIINCCAVGHPSKFSTYFKDLSPVLLNNLNSPLAAPYLTKTYVKFSDCVFYGSSRLFGKLVGHVILRLLKPHCDLDPAWEEEPLTSAVPRTISNMQKLYTFPETLNAPSFTYCFPLLQTALLQEIGKNDDPLLEIGLTIITEHAQMRGKHDADLWHPKFLPRKQMFQLLTEIIGRTTGRIQQLACNCLLEVAKGGSGETNGCCRATDEEISVLLSALQSPSHIVREAGLRGLTEMYRSLPSVKENYELGVLITRRIWVASHDVKDDNCVLAKNLWNLADLKLMPQVLCQELLKDVIHPVDAIQQSGAKSLAALISTNLHLNLLRNVLTELQNIYMDKLVMIPPKVNNLGRITEHPIDVWEPRSGVALALQELAPYLEPDIVSQLVSFFVTTGLGDRKPEVRKNMLSAGLAIVDQHGKNTVNSLLPIFEEFLDKAPDSSSYDAVRQSVVILMGSLARHLDKDDKKIKPIVDRLIDALSTPSQQVQEAVANCLPPLVPAIKDNAPVLVKKLLHQLLDSDNYGERKGAAYGLAGIVKGMGILALKQLDIMTTLTTAIQNKKNYRHREGALFAFEMLCNMLGRLFEPYIVHVLPYLLLCFGDTSQFVRDATDDTARVVMSKLSAHGVKLVLPSLLAALEEDSWRTKTGSVELLGAMAYCAPKQLSSCLPSIVPKLIEVLSDSHIKVQKAGAQALKVIGSVIRNPEIQAIVPYLLEALQDPSSKTATSLQTLLDTKFVHFIDAPSLALIMPVVQRAFHDRSTETRKMAAQIIGNMYSLTDQKDLSPYLPNIIPGLKTSLLDPVPEVRSVSARALGAMVRGMGEASFEDLLPWLMQTLTSESSSVDRSGAAQGLSEVVGGLGVEKLHKLMPDIIATSERTDIAPHVKDGYIMMFIYMPVVFTTEFTPYIGKDNQSHTEGTC